MTVSRTTNGTLRQIAVGLAIVGLIGGGFIWMQANYVSATEFERAQKITSEQLVGLSSELAVIKLILIDRELFDRRRELEVQPTSKLLRERIHELERNRRILENVIFSQAIP